MYNYRDYCPIAKAAQVLCERWTLLIIREMLEGCTRFSHFQRYLPRISPSLLKERLRTLEECGLVVRKKIPEQRGFEYHLTAAGRELEPVIMQLGAWSLRWIYEGMTEDEINVDALMRDIAHQIVVDKLPGGRTVLHFRFTDLDKSEEWYLIVEDGKIDLCDDKLMIDADVYFTSTLKTLAEVWMGDRSLQQALDSGSLKIVGPQSYLRILNSWIGLSYFAGLERRVSADAR
jgi:DNA-binding HxlR family transcriptional regulator